MKQTKITLFILIALAASGLWAKGAGETTNEKVTFTMKEQNYEPVRDIEVAPTGEILAAFESLGVDSYYLLQGTRDLDDDNEVATPPPVTQEVRNQLNSIISENRGNVVDLINGELQTRLHRGGAEAAHMILGSYYFSASLDYPEK